MDQNERRSENKVTIDKDAQINVVVNRSGEEDASIDLGRVFHNMKVRRRVFTWVLVLCLVVGVCAPLLLYQFNRPMLTVSSVVTLNYEIPMVQNNGRLIPLAQYETELAGKGELLPNNIDITWVSVTDLTAPDGNVLDLSMITSSYVLQQALSEMELSQPISLSALRSNIIIERVLTDESRQAQELANKMTNDKNAAAYEQMQAVEMKYEPKFVVRLKNGFESNGSVIVLGDGELQTLLSRILAAYNDYLVMTYADMKLPDDELSVISVERLDILETLDLMRTASDNLYAYCSGQRDSVRKYRSYRDGRSLEDWMLTIRTGREVSIDYLYSHVYTDSIVRDRETMKTSYKYQLQNAETKRDIINKNIATNESILENYKNDQIYVSMQESDGSKSTMQTTDSYNKLILEQAKNYGELAKLEIQISDLYAKIGSLEKGDTNISDEVLEEATLELQKALEASRTVYEGVKAHMEEIFGSAFYTNYAKHTVPQGKLPNFLSANLKTMLIGAVAGLVIACGLWFLAALAPEFRRGRKDDEEEKGAGDGSGDKSAGEAVSGKEAAQA